MDRISFSEKTVKTSETFAEKAANAVRLIEYIESRGLRAWETRLGEYSRFYRRYLSGACSDEEIKTKLLFVMREMDEWSWIYRGLTKIEPEGSFELLKQAIGGVAFASGEAADTRPRNIQLELRVASYFLQTGFSVSFSGLSDLVVDVDGIPVFVECKRLNSPRQVIKRAKEAAHQLKNRYQNSRERSYGMVVLDASRIVHPKQGIVSGVTETTVRDGLRTQLKAFDLEYDTSTVFAKDKRLISVWIQVIAPGFYYTEEDPSTRFSSMHSIYAHEGQTRWNIFQKMKPAFEAS